MHMTGKKERRGDKRKGNLKASILRTQIQTFTIKCMQPELIHLYAINYVVSFIILQTLNHPLMHPWVLCQGDSSSLTQRIIFVGSAGFS